MFRELVVANLNSASVPDSHNKNLFTFNFEGDQGQIQPLAINFVVKNMKSVSQEVFSNFLVASVCEVHKWVSFVKILIKEKGNKIPQDNWVIEGFV